MRSAAVCLLIMSLMLASCKKDGFYQAGDAFLNYSANSISFDTVFTRAGSVTQILKVTNPYDRKLRIGSIELGGGDSSAFHLNIDGRAASSASNLTLDASDSLYVFVTVSIDPDAHNRPFLVQDSIAFTYNGKTDYVYLQAYGQNAHYLQNPVVEGTRYWSADLPYVILGSLRIDTGATLYLLPGCRLYLHADAPVLVDGTLRAIGDTGTANRIVFRSDRLDAPYSAYPAGWPGIYFRTASRENELDYADILNAYQALVVNDPSPNGIPKLSLNACIVDNAYDAGILGVNTSITATNCLVSNCGSNVELLYGGVFNFTNCTLAGYSNSYVTHANPVLYFSNGVVESGQVQAGDLNLHFINSILWGDGSVPAEISLDRASGGSVSARFDNCLLRGTFPAGVDSSQLILDEDPSFALIDNPHHAYDFRLQPGSPAIDRGRAAGVVTDLLGNPRDDGKPDLGCYEAEP